MGPNNIKWWKCKDEMTVEYRERVRRKYEELDSEKGTMEGEWGQYNMHLLGWRSGCVAERLGNEVLREAETNYGGRKGWRRQWGKKREAWKMIEGIIDRGEQPSTGLRHLYGQKKKEGGGRSTEEYGGRTVPKA